MDPCTTGMGNQRHADNIGPEMMALPDFSHLDCIEFGFVNDSSEKQSILVQKMINQWLTNYLGGQDFASHFQPNGLSLVCILHTSLLGQSSTEGLEARGLQCLENKLCTLARITKIIHVEPDGINLKLEPEKK